MPNQIFILAVLALTIVAPLALILSFLAKWKASKGLSAEEQRTIEELWREGEAMRDRIEALETILDDRVPNWRRAR